jgi:hypothetical protein
MGFAKSLNLRAILSLHHLLILFIKENIQNKKSRVNYNKNTTTVLNRINKTTKMLLNFNLFIILLLVVVAGLLIFTLYYLYINKSKINTSNTIVNSNNKINSQLLQANAGGAMVPYGNAVPNNDYFPNDPTTVVELTDAELNELLQIIFAEIGNSNIIEVQLLQSLGMYTDTIVAVLQALGYIIN